MSNTKKASDIVKDAIKLANMGNTRFATHGELTDYINDGFISIYNNLIDKGNEYWLKEATASQNGKGYWLPQDFYRAKSVKCRGHLVPRASRSASGYSIRNGQLFLGDYPSSGSVTLEYYPKPTYISFPSTTVDTILGTGIVTTYKDWYLTSGDCVITNINTKETINTNLSETLDTSAYVYLGEGLICGYDYHGDRYVWDWNGNVIVPLQGCLQGVDGNLYGFSDDEQDLDYAYIYNIVLDAGVGRIKKFPNMDKAVVYQNSDQAINGFMCWNNGNVYFVDFDGNVYESQEPSFFKDWDSGQASLVYLPEWDDNAYAFYYKASNVVEIYTINTETGYLDRLEYKIPGVVNYGLVYFESNRYFISGTMLKRSLVGYEPDTKMDYPDNVFYRALASYIAIQLLAKQGADTTNMKASFSSLVSTFNQSKDSSADYPVISTYY